LSRKDIYLEKATERRRPEVETVTKGRGVQLVTFSLYQNREIERRKKKVWQEEGRRGDVRGRKESSKKGAAPP